MGAAESFDRNWAEVAKEFDRMYAMTTGSVEQESNGDLKDVIEEHLHRPMGEPAAGRSAPAPARIMASASSSSTWIPS